MIRNHPLNKTWIYSPWADILTLDDPVALISRVKNIRKFNYYLEGLIYYLGAGPKSLRTAKSRSNLASPCGNVLPTHTTDHCDNIVHACLCSVTLGFRIFVLADRSIGNRASTWDWYMGTGCFWCVSSGWLTDVFLELQAVDLQVVALSRIAGLKYAPMSVHTWETAFKHSLLQVIALSRIVGWNYASMSVHTRQPDF